MNWMNLKDNFLILVATLLVFLSSSSALLAQQTAFDELKERFESGEIFNAGFSHQYIDSYTQDTSVPTNLPKTTLHLPASSMVPILLILLKVRKAETTPYLYPLVPKTPFPFLKMWRLP